MRVAGWKYLLSLLLASVMMFSVIWFADLELLTTKLADVSAPGLLMLVGTYMATIWFRASRFRVLLEPAARTWHWYRLTALHNFFFTFVPFKLGEASFLPLAKQRSVAVPESAAALVLCRVFEISILCCMGFAGAVSLGMVAPVLPVLVLLAGALLLSLQFDRLASWAAGFSRLLYRQFRWDWADRLASSFVSSREWFIVHKKDRWPLLGLTLLVCVLASLSVFLSFWSLDVDLTPGKVLFLYAGLAFLGAAGVSTVAGIGVSEFGLAGLLVLLGFPLPQATTLALLARLFLLLSTLVGTALILVLTRASESEQKRWAG